TLIAPHVVLTAAHCLEDYGAIPGVTLALDLNGVGASDVRSGTLAIQHPSYDPDADLEAGPGQYFDLGILVLAEAIEGVVPATIATAGEAAALLSAGADVELVGYGASEVMVESKGIKRRAV